MTKKRKTFFIAYLVIKIDQSTLVVGKGRSHMVASSCTTADIGGICPSLQLAQKAVHDCQTENLWCLLLKLGLPGYPRTAGMLIPWVPYCSVPDTFWVTMLWLIPGIPGGGMHLPTLWMNPHQTWDLQYPARKLSFLHAAHLTRMVGYPCHNYGLITRFEVCNALRMWGYALCNSRNA